ncbi:MAG: hypothetical protein B6U86_03130 [Candidatus Altiarchaeales archaeon ex4484_43]|nr:MAG: hypothetical protein B6U86_03130 [Candidatus Altiarchaeales archaeon ex4484_43]RLI89568.1 MAG: hypothetical protein DRO62_01275 [Candidatus Altiarchaeales archaeon]
MADPEKINPERVGIRMDVLDNIIDDLNNNEELKAIFGEPVSKALVVVADNNDLRIEDGGVVELTGEQEKRFLDILDEVIRANSI